MRRSELRRLQAEIRAEKRATAAQVFTHGISGYNRGCRCEVCRNACREKARKRRAAGARTGLIAGAGRGAGDHAPREWRENAACRGQNPRVFYEYTNRDLPVLRAFCAECATRNECLEFALANREPAGLWGGYTTKEREQLSRRGAT